ncbi:MAG: hypothetical protein KDD50_08890 [Bdellovibrionales bacterium]|nr:hypothetical protein [Bdellovibrionales bacterium]
MSTFNEALDFSDAMVVSYTRQETTLELEIKQYNGKIIKLTFERVSILNDLGVMYEDLSHVEQTRIGDENVFMLYTANQDDLALFTVYAETVQIS